MGTYTSSKGIQIDTATMAQPYLERALNKAREKGDEANVKALEEELVVRETNQ